MTPVKESAKVLSFVFILKDDTATDANVRRVFCCKEGEGTTQSLLKLQ